MTARSPEQIAEPLSARKVLFDCWVHGNGPCPGVPVPMRERPTPDEIEAARRHMRDDLPFAIEVADQRAVAASEKDGVVESYVIPAADWNRIVAVARGHVSERARATLDEARLDAIPAKPELEALVRPTVAQWVQEALVDVVAEAWDLNITAPDLGDDDPLSDLDDALGTLAERLGLAHSQSSEALRAALAAALRAFATPTGDGEYAVDELGWFYPRPTSEIFPPVGTLGAPTPPAERQS